MRLFIITWGFSKGICACFCGQGA